MKEQLKRNDSLSFVLYKKNSAPLYFKLKDSSVKRLLIIIPLLLGLLIISLLTSIWYYEGVISKVTTEAPKVLTAIKGVNAELVRKEENYIAQIKSFNINKAQFTKKEERSFMLNELSFFNKASTQKDRTAEDLLDTQNIEALTLDKKLYLRFNLINKSKEKKKVSGRIFVLMKHQEAIYHYPSKINRNSGFHISYLQGEHFSTSKFRPVEAFFPLKDSENSLFKIIIFDNQGNLLYTKTISHIKIR